MKSTLQAMTPLRQTRIGCWCPGAAVAFIFLATSCSGGGSPASDGAVDAGDAAPLDPNQDIGFFLIQLIPAKPAAMDLPATPAQTSLQGRVRSGSEPDRIVWRMTGQQGPCRLVEPEIPFCNPACGTRFACTEGGRCQAEPVARNPGTIRIQGLHSEAGAQEITVSPEPPQFDYQLPTGLRLVYPPFPPDGTVRLSADAGDVGAFVLQTRAIAPLDIPASGTPTVRPASGFALRWAPPPAGSTAVVHVLFDLSLHAGTKGKIECEAPDTGALDVPATLMDRLIALGTAGYPKVVVSRRSVATTGVAAGRVKLTVFCEIERELMIEGQTSCTEDAGCPAGRRCNLDKLLCE